MPSASENQPRSALLDKVCAQVREHFGEAGSTLLRAAAEIACQTQCAKQDPQAIQRGLDTAALLAPLNLDPAALAAALVAPCARNTDEPAQRFLAASRDPRYGLWSSLQRHENI